MYGSNIGRRKVRAAAATQWLAIWAALFCVRSAGALVLTNWQAGSESLPAENTPAGLVFNCPFPENTARHFWDHAFELEGREYDGLEVDYTCENPGAFHSITWYLRCGKEWFSVVIPASAGRGRHWLNFADFRQGEKCANGRRIAAVRLSPWSAHRGAGRIILHDLQPLRTALAVTRPGAVSLPEASEQAFGRQAAEWLEQQLYRLGLPAAALDDADLGRREIISRYRLICLPCHINLADTAVKNFAYFINHGGRLIVCYNAQPQLAQLLGMTAGKYLTADRVGKWHAMRFMPDAAWQGPAVVYQGAIRNLLTIEPNNRDTAVLAWWSDAAGNRQKEAACVIAPTGAWFSHVLPREDAAAQRKMLAALLDKYLPGTFARAASNLLHAALQEAETVLSETPDESDAAKAIATLCRKVHAQLTEQRPATEIWLAAEKLALAATQHKAQRTAATTAKIARGVWIGHALEGEAPDKPAQELAPAGFTDVFVYFPRHVPPATNTAAAYRRAGLHVHAWHICWNVEDAQRSDLAQLQKDGRLQQSAAGQMKNWLCPVNPANVAAETEALAALAAIPDLDGIHLDYIRYPDAEHCFCQTCRRAFEAAAGQAVKNWPEDVYRGELAEAYRQWRAEQINDFVRKVSIHLRKAYPKLKLSAAVYPLHPDCRQIQGQDWPVWLRAGWLDFVCPMNYTANSGEFSAWTLAQIAAAAGGEIWAGIGATADQSRLTPGQVFEQSAAAAKAGAAGYVIFALDYTLRRELLPLMQKNPPPAQVSPAFQSTEHACSLFPATPCKICPSESANASLF